LHHTVKELYYGSELDTVVSCRKTARKSFLSSETKITVVGPGAMGCLLAACLYRAGHPVSLLDYREDRAGKLAATGIHVESKQDGWNARPRVTADPTALGHQDWIVFLVKAGQTSEAASRISSMIGPGTMGLTLQNGLGHEHILAEALPLDSIALGVTAQGATLLSDGCVRHAGIGPTVLGLVKAGGPKDKLQVLADILEASQWPCSLVQDIYPHVWKKLLVNVGINAVTALTGLPNGALLEHQEAGRLLSRAVEEAWRVSKAHGAGLELSLDEALRMVTNVCAATSRNSSSMLQDRLKKKNTEIDYINGAIVRFGRQLGIDTPVNEALSLLVRLNTRLRWEVSPITGE
jgi:2-dehydropantoate 2-reductase